MKKQKGDLLATKRKIAIYTGNRAEYGLQFPIIKAIDEHPNLEYYLLVSGAHLQEDFGYTVREIERDGFKVYSEVKMTMGRDDLYATAQAIGTGILSLSEILEELRPDMLVVYADRFEGFSAVITGTQMNIPTAHIEGGDLTEGGALDDSVRHAMTKLAHLHFTTNEEAAERVRKLGEEPWRVRNVGFPALDLVARGIFAKAEELVERYQIEIEQPLLIFTQHSVTTEFELAGKQIDPVLEALRELANRGVQTIVTYPNNDAGGQEIIKHIQDSNIGSVQGVQVHKSLGRYNYHGFLNLCGRVGRGACVGNSSSGIKETPAFGCPAVNIGSRQQGRLRAENVIDCGYEREAVIAACEKALFDEKFREQCQNTFNPYGVGDAGPKIAKVIADVELGPRLVQKRMTY